jgi:Dyp-type peroxidase family
MKSALRFDQIQGNITPGLRKRRQAFMLLRFTSRETAGAWLKALAPSVTSARAVREFYRRRRQRKAGYEELTTSQSTWVNAAISWDGLAVLGAPDIDAFPEDFRQGMRQRAEAQLNDEKIDRWEIGGTLGVEPHTLLILAADTEAELDAEIGRQRELARTHKLDELKTYFGAQLDGALRGHEHFGYRDGISQPDKEVPGAAPAWGEFVLGHVNQVGQRAPGPSWAQNGSYAVFRRLRQDVAGFRNAVETQALKIGRITPEQLGAKLVGRSTSGAKLTESGAGLETPKWSGYDAIRVTPADFERDPDGERTPHFAHIRKANPRDPEARHHRLLRRGIPYGPALPPGVEDKVDRGLLFLAYQASLANQFEHVQRNWLNNAKFPTPQTGRDPLVGQPGGANELVLPLKGGPASLTLGQFVTMTGGGYFFSPSIDALTQLANVAIREATTMADDNSRLGEFILRQDPYNWKALGLPGRPLPATFDSSPDVKMTGMGKHHDANNPFDFEYTPDQPQYWEGGLFWNLGDTTVRISKAVRIDYEYEDNDGKLVRKGLVIGFEGSGGGM